MIEDEKEWRTIIVNGKEVEVAEDGQIRHDVINNATKTITTVTTYGYTTNLGYKVCNIGGSTVQIHRLVANAFLDPTFPIRRKDNPADKREIQHNIARDNNEASAITIVCNHKYNCSSPYSRKNYRNHNKRLTKYYDGLEAINPKTGKVVKTFKGTWQDVAEWLNKPVTTVKGNIGHALNCKGPKEIHTAYGFQWKRLQKQLTPWEQHLKDYRAEYYKKVTKPKREKR